MVFASAGAEQRLPRLAELEWLPLEGRWVGSTALAEFAELAGFEKLPGLPMGLLLEGRGVRSDWERVPG